MQNFYDAAGRKIRVVDAENGTSEFTYDKAGNIVNEILRDSKGAGDRVTAFVYDKLNRQLTETIEPNSALQRVLYAYTYDAVGNKLTRTFPDGTLTTYVYNALNKITAVNYTGAAAENRTGEYALSGLVTKATDQSGITQYTYDKIGRVLTEIKKTLAGAVVSQITNVYDKAGNRTRVTYPNNRILSSTYDKRNLLKTITDGASVTTYAYDANGNRTNLALPNGINTATEFDAANRVVSINETANGTEIYKAMYYCDRTGARLKIVESRNNVVVRNSIFTYDRTDKLLSENDGTTDINYTYDDADNRITKTVNGVQTVYEVDKLNRVLSATTGGTVDATYTYDLNGSRLSKTQNSVTHNYVYDRENRIVTVQNSGTAIFSAIYDYRTRRMHTLDEGVEKSYIYDGGDCVQERNNAGSLTKQFIRGTGLGGGIGSILYKDEPSADREYFLYNVIGSTVATTNPDASVKSTSLYEAFGNVIASTGTSV